MMFEDRKDAGRRLAKALEKYADEDVIVFALPRGGVVLGAEIARSLGAPLDLIIAKKIGHPRNSEYAIGAMADEGPPLWNPAETQDLEPRWLEEEVKKGRREIERRREIYLGGRAPYHVEGKTAIIVDDGIATGLTMMAAISEMKRRHPRRLIVAIPVTPSSTAQRLSAMVDDLVSLDIDAHYRGTVGAYYEDFNQVEDREVIALLQSIEKRGDEHEQ